ncbi:DUF2235 domain-containing protein [Sphingomonas mollis]|uniref:DUF2235 domain-containing protein n=1 Tax=Sphingomonas mollis TaxID=2795726 RepID=A0ABS0XUC0_9SPHN|nr:DUF2235 domain-containing protein [Sphingomonas sp. BT553]MBJ6123640.1 DUF2235 domain-containing protein [Sphingomonas sp. BT553]
MAKTLVVCCDGTWNTPDQAGRPTNVTKMARAILPRAADGSPQLVYYDKGVGTGNRLDRFLGGTLGIGLGENVQDAYRFLALNYEPGDRLAMFGFSRGAFTVRSLAGLVGLAGLLRKGDLDRMPAVWEYYRTKPADRRNDFLDQRWIEDRRPGVDLLGVWDTVGALGIPGNVLGRIGRRRYEFHDVKLGRTTKQAYQALAVDEFRRSFVPAVWDTSSIGSDQRVEQVWFVGAHSNVGGGYPDPVLSDQAFLWMVARSKEMLSFDENYLKRRVEVLADDKTGGLAVDAATGKWALLGKRLRVIGSDRSETVHPSVLARMRAVMSENDSTPPFDPFPYKPKNVEDYLAKSTAG